MATLMRAGVELQHTRLLADIADNPESIHLQRRQKKIQEDISRYSEMLSRSIRYIDTEDLKEKTQDCVEAMGFFQGRFGLRSTIQKMNSKSSQKSSTVEASTSEVDTVSSNDLFLWREPDGQWFIASNSTV